MTPKKKAKQLMQKAYDLDQYKKTTKNKCKKIALFCVNEIIEATQKKYINASGTGLDVIPIEYWINVKEELNLL